MGAHADGADLPLGLQLLGKLHHRSAEHLIEIHLLVHVVDHPHVDVVCPQPAEQVVVGGFHFLYVPGALVLAVHPGGAQVPLEDEFLPAPRHGLAEGVPDVGLRVVQVKVVDPQLYSGVQNLQGGLLLPVHKGLAAQSDLADFHSRAA